MKMERLEEILGENRQEYQKRLEYYKACLQRNRLHMQSEESVKKKTDAGVSGNGMTIPYVREEVFLFVWLPVLTEYVEWVLSEATKNEKKRLYFLARDGYMMYLMAKKLVDAREMDLDVRYLKISRFSIRNAEYYFAGKAALDTLCVGGIDINFEKIMKRANLTEEESLHIARLAGYTENYKTALSYRQLCRLKEELSQIDQLFVYLKKHSKDWYDTTVSYLRQEGLLEEIPYALVDSGWMGTLQLSLQRVLEHAKAGKVRLEGYYFGLYARPAGTQPGQYRSFYFGEKEILRKVSFSNCLFEAVFSAPEGMTCGYRLREQELAEHVYEAVENEGGNPNADVLEHFAELLMEYASAYGRHSMDSGVVSVNSSAHRSRIHNSLPYNLLARKSVDCMLLTRNSLARNAVPHKARVRFVESLLKPMMGNPTQWEAGAFGGLLFCDDVLEQQLQPVAARWEAAELRKQRFFNKILIKMNLKSGILHESAWPEGSIARLGKQAGNPMRQEKLYKCFMYLRKALGK